MGLLCQSAIKIRRAVTGDRKVQPNPGGACRSFSEGRSKGGQWQFHIACRVEWNSDEHGKSKMENVFSTGITFCPFVKTHLCPFVEE
jgi:hypothetical protein